MTPAAGMLVSPSVRLVRSLGVGGMGAVWIADHLTLHTQVVVKFMSAELAANEEARVRFSREAAVASAVKSPHVVQTFDHGIVDGAPFIVMELLDGEDLRHRFEREPALSLEELAAILTQACKALGRAHKTGIVHRDIKPDNVFLCRTDDAEVFVKLLDFGIAKQGDVAAELGATKTGAMMGTPFYMSPEQVLGSKSIDQRTDLWSLGVLAFQGMTGRRAFDGDTVGAIAVAITHGAMPTPSTVNPALSPALDDWFARACARDPNARFASARELADAFQRAVSGERSTAPLVPMGDGGSAPLASVTALRAGATSLNTTTSPTIQSDGPPDEIEAAAGVPRRGDATRSLVVLAVAAAVVLLVTVALVAGRVSATTAAATTAAAPEPSPQPSASVHVVTDEPRVEPSADPTVIASASPTHPPPSQGPHVPAIRPSTPALAAASAHPPPILASATATTTATATAPVVATATVAATPAPTAAKPKATNPSLHIGLE